MSDDPRAIAGKLTEAQRRVLTEGAYFCPLRNKLRASGHCTPKWHLCRLGILYDYLGSPTITPLGLAVREALKNMEASNG